MGIVRSTTVFCHIHQDAIHTRNPSRKNITILRQTIPQQRSKLLNRNLRPLQKLRKRLPAHPRSIAVQPRQQIRWQLLRAHPGRA